MKILNFNHVESNKDLSLSNCPKLCMILYERGGNKWIKYSSDTGPERVETEASLDCLVYKVFILIHNNFVNTFIRLSTASLTTCTGLAKSGIAFPSSASSCKMTSLDT